MDLLSLPISPIIIKVEKKTKTKFNFKQALANFFGGLGYFVTSFAWLWVFVVYSNYILDFLNNITPEQETTTKVVEQASIGASADSGVILPILAALITIAIIVLTIFVIIKIPSTIVKTSKKVVYETAENVAPLVLKVQKKPDTKRRRVKLTKKIVMILKVLFIFLPLIAVILYKFVPSQELQFSIAIIVSVILNILGIIAFVAQYLLTYIFKLKSHDNYKI